MISQFSYTVVMMNMKLPADVTPPYIYHGCSTRKTFWEEKLKGKEDLFLSVNKKFFYSHKVRKHKEIKVSNKYVTLNISLKFDSVDKIETTYSESRRKLETSGKGLVTSLGFKTKVRSKYTKRQGMPSKMSVRRTS